MNKVNISRLIIVMLVSIAMVAISQAQHTEYETMNVVSNALGNWYACTYGDFQPACDAIGEDAGKHPTADALGNWYACTYGDFQPACDAINLSYR